MNSNFNNIGGTVSNSFVIGAGSDHNVRHFALTAITTGADVLAGDYQDTSIDLYNVEFYDVKLVAKDSANQIVAKQLRGTIFNGVVTRIEDIFQEGFGADVTITAANNLLSILCKHTANETSYTIYITLTRVTG